jgi:hypothetical protein
MAHCENCGRNDATRVIVTLGACGQTEKCNLCAPPGDSDFSGAAMVPSDKKMWPDWVANPHLYKKRGDALVATDECKADLQEEVMGSPVADAETSVAIAKKRAFARERNVRPLTQVEIDDRVRIFREQAEEQKIYQAAEDAGLVLP